ncbi:hypothetical protein [Providencia hangzhouensis]|uniref:hypothetical protein n=1 Tax=Providencia hangzhouensis TaxID=3031799 RepID=UPI0034DD547D
MIFNVYGNPVGYYSTLTSQTHSGNTLILCHQNIYKPEISDKWLLDDIFIEVDWQGNIIWQWAFSHYFSRIQISAKKLEMFYIVIQICVVLVEAWEMIDTIIRCPHRAKSTL